MSTPKKTYQKLRAVIESRRPKALINRFIEWGLTFVTPENLTWAIENNVDPLVISFNHYHLGEPIVSPLARTVFQCFWEYIEAYLTEAPKVYEVLTRKPENKAILDTPQGREYLNQICRRCYEFLFAFTWK